MRLPAFAVALVLIAGAAHANTCHAEHSTCSTSMPAGGYCECFHHGEADSGTVMEAGMMHHHHHHVQQ